VFIKADKLGDLADPDSPAFDLMVKTFNKAGGWEANPDVWWSKVVYALEQDKNADVKPEYDPKRDTNTWEMWDLLEAGVDRAIREAGYDGVKLVEMADSKVFGLDNGGKPIVSWAVFDPRQIKSADENIGTYDPENPNSLYSTGEGAHEKLVREHVQAGKYVKDAVLEPYKDQGRPWAVEAWNRLHPEEERALQADALKMPRQDFIDLVDSPFYDESVIPDRIRNLPPADKLMELGVLWDKLNDPVAGRKAGNQAFIDDLNTDAGLKKFIASLRGHGDDPAVADAGVPLIVAIGQLNRGEEIAPREAKAIRTIAQARPEVMRQLQMNLFRDQEAIERFKQEGEMSDLQKQIDEAGGNAETDWEEASRTNAEAARQANKSAEAAKASLKSSEARVQWLRKAAAEARAEARRASEEIAADMESLANEVMFKIKPDLTKHEDETTTSQEAWKVLLDDNATREEKSAAREVVNTIRSMQRELRDAAQKIRAGAKGAVEQEIGRASCRERVFLRV